MPDTASNAGTSAAPGPDRKELVYRAVLDLATGTAGEIAARAAIPYSTVTPKLRALLDDNRVEAYHDDDGRTRWRPAAAPPETLTAASPIKPVDDGAIDPATSTLPDPPPSAEAADPDPAAPGGPQQDPDPGEPPSTATPVPGNDVTVTAPRRPKGAVRAAILAAFTAAEPGTGYKVQQLHHLTGIGQGALANSLFALVNEGLIIQVVDRPATFQAIAPQ